MSIIPNDQNLIQHNTFKSNYEGKNTKHYTKEYRQKVANNQIKSQYLNLLDLNKHRSFALVTFTSHKKNDIDKLLHILEVRDTFIQKLKNLRIKINYVASIELSGTHDNPHLHFQLFYDNQDYDRIIKAYQKVVSMQKLRSGCCDINNRTSYKELRWGLYIIKEYDNKKLDKKGEYELIKLMSARETYRKRLDLTTKFKYIVMSQRKLPQKVYSTLFKKTDLNYHDVDALFDEVFDYAISDDATIYSVKIDQYVLNFNKNRIDEHLNQNIKMLQLRKYFQIKEMLQVLGTFDLDLTGSDLLESSMMFLDYIQLLMKASKKIRKKKIKIHFILKECIQKQVFLFLRIPFCFVFA